MSQTRRVGLVAATSAILFGCSTNNSLTSVAENARSRVAAEEPVVVFLPGTLAATLENSETGEQVWGRREALSVDPRTPAGLRQLSLPITPVASTVSSAKDAIRPKDLLRRAGRTFLGIRVSVPIYEDAMKAFVSAGLPETAPLAIPAKGPSVTPFPYDWRRSIVDGARALGEALEARGEDAQKVVLVGHSMGGAVALHYLMYGTAALDPDQPLPDVTWAGAKHVRHAVLVGAPLRGAVVAIRNSINGNEIAGPLIPTFPTTMLATHPSSFELMPRVEEATLRNRDGTPTGNGQFDPAFWQSEGWGLANPLESEQRTWLSGAEGHDVDALALDRQAMLMRRATVFHAMTDRPIDPPEGLTLMAIAGIGEDTPSVVRIAGDHRVEVIGKEDGDATVTRASASAGFEDSDSHPRKTLFLKQAEHARLVSDSVIFDRIMKVIAPE